MDFLYALMCAYIRLNNFDMPCLDFAATTTIHIYKNVQLPFDIFYRLGICLYACVSRVKHNVTIKMAITIITDPPQVTLSLGSTLKPDDIKEGDDVYFECHIKANPKEHRITWSHNVSNESII